MKAVLGGRMIIILKYCHQQLGLYGSFKNNCDCFEKKFIVIFGQVLSVYIFLVDLASSAGIDLKLLEYLDDEAICQ